MGDRCYLKLTLHGELNSPRHLVKIAKALVAENMTSDIARDNVDNVYATLARFIDDNADVATENPEFTDDECNYANIDDLEDVLQQCGVSYSVYHGAGGGYSAGVWSWCPEWGTSKAEATEDGDAVIPKWKISNAVKEEDPVAAVKKLLLDAERAEGAGLPIFRMGGHVKRVLASRLAVKALTKAA